MPTAYQVKRPEPLAFEGFQVVIHRNPADKDFSIGGDILLSSGRFDPQDYVMAIKATVTARNIASGKRTTIGNMKAYVLLVNKATESQWGLR